MPERVRVAFLSARCSSASLGLTAHSHVDVLGVLHSTNPSTLQIRQLWSGREPGRAKSVSPTRLRQSSTVRFREGLVFKARRLLYHSTLGLRVIKKKTCQFAWLGDWRSSEPYTRNPQQRAPEAGPPCAWGERASERER